MLVVNRFRVPEPEGAAFRETIEAAVAVLQARPGLLEATVGRNVDDPTLWLLSTRWQHVGAYRRALSSYDVKVHVVPLLSRSLDEPSAFEIVEPGTDLNERADRSLG